MVAFKESVPRNINQMQLTVDPADIKDYFNADYMKIMIGFYTQENEELIGTAKFRVNYSFKIIAKMP
jgi:protein tyrosine phosphatase